MDKVNLMLEKIGSIAHSFIVAKSNKVIGVATLAVVIAIVVLAVL